MAPSEGRDSESDYVGESGRHGRRVFIQRAGERAPLPYRGPGEQFGYAWGRAGIAARELARAILADATENVPLADRLCREYTWEVIVALPREGFRLKCSEVRDWVERQPPRADALSEPPRPA